MIAVYLILLLISIILFLCALYKEKEIRHLEHTNKEIENEILLAQAEKMKLEKEKAILDTEKSYLQMGVKDLEKEILVKEEILNNTIEQRKEKMQLALEHYSLILEESYKETDVEYETMKKTMEESYSKKQIELLKEIEETKLEIDKIKSLKESAVAAQLREQEIKDNILFYCLPIKQNDLFDVKTLSEVKEKLSNSRTLSKLIWTDYFQKNMTALCNNVLGTKPITGIYKITNQKNEMCYIGQAVNYRPVKNFS